MRLYIKVALGYHFPDKVDVCQLPFMLQEVWSTTTSCQLPSQQKRQQSRMSSFSISFKELNILFLKLRIVFSLTKHLEKSYSHDQDFLSTVSNALNATWQQILNPIKICSSIFFLLPMFLGKIGHVQSHGILFCTQFWKKMWAGGKEGREGGRGEGEEGGMFRKYWALSR